MTRHLRPVLASFVLVAVLAALVPVSVASAQELGEEPPADGESTPPSSEVDEQPRGDDPAEDPTAGAFEVTGERLPVPDDVTTNGRQGMIVWPEGRRVYQLLSGGGSLYDGNALAAFDLDTLQEVDRAVIAEPGTALYGDQWSHAAAGVMPVDATGGRLFLPYMSTGLGGECPVDITTDACIAGIYVVDARTLEVRADLPFQPIGIDGIAVQPALRAMSYVGQGPAGGKLLLLVGAQGLGDSPANLAPSADRAGVSYAMQLDPADGSVDWVQRVAGCTSTRQAAEVSAASRVRNVIFRSDLAGRPPEIYLGCYASGGGGVIVRLTLNPDQPDAPPVAQQAFPGPGPVSDMVGDPQSGRVLLRATPGSGDSLVVFDGQRSAFTTALGIGGDTGATATGYDPVDGRLYAISTRSAVGGGPGPSRFLAGTTRGDTLPQLTPVPGLADLVARHQTVNAINEVPLVVDPATVSRPARVLVRPGATARGAPDFYYVVEDRRPPGAVIGGDLVRDVPFTDDVSQVAGATDAVFTGAGRGYGFRTLLVGGVAAFASQRGATGRMLNQSPGESVDNLGGLIGVREVYPEEGLADRTAPIGDSCIARDREFVFGLAGALDVLPDLGPTGSAGQAVAATTDAQTAEDLAAPSRCGEGLVALVSTLLADAGVRQPGQVEGVGLSPAWAEAGCVAPGERTSDEQGSQITPASTSFAAVTCEEGRRTTGTGRVRLVELGPVTVGEASSSFQIDREPGGGLVTTVRSIARDIDVAGVVQIDAVESTAVSWATGRSQPAGTDGFNCAQGRTAGTCLKRTLQGVTAGDFRCDQCAVTDEQMLAALKGALGSGWTVTVGEPDAFLAQGAANGALAGILKSPDRQFSDSALNSDILPTLPALELVRINDDSIGRGRQVYQFAGVEASTSFGILCLLEVIDGECTQQPGALSIELLDLDGLPLAGGVFELYRDLDGAATDDPTDDPSPDPTAADADASPTPDPDATDDPSPDPTETEPAGDGGSTPPASPDGSLVDPLVDELVDGGVCTTTANGSGDCRFDTLAPGDYIVRQAAAPAGFLAAPDFAITIASGQDLTATFTNVSAIGQVDITLTDGDGAPLPGGAFALAPAAGGGDGAATAPAGSCTTGDDGTCSITVALPDGPAELVLTQTVAPDGFAPAPDTPLTLAPGETFTFAFTNVRPLGGTISIGLVDDLTDAPLAGGRFEVHADDGDGELGAPDTLVATCTTGSDGACVYDPVTTDAASLGRDGPLFASGALLTVPLGAYVVRQATAPDGYAPADDLAFAFDAPGQAAAITIRNGSATAADGTRPQGSSQVSIGSAPSFSPAPIASGPLPLKIDVPAPQVAPTDGTRMGGPTVQQILQAPADLARLVVRDPRQALAFIATWLLFAAAAMTISRRLTLTDTLAT